MPIHSYAPPGTLQSAGAALNSLAAGAKALGTAIGNDGGDTHANLELTFQFGTAPAAGRSLAVYLLKSVDGSTYEDGDGAGETPPHSALVAVAPCDARTTEQVVVIEGVPLPNCHFKFLVVNHTDQALDGAGNSLDFETYNYESA